jgi:epoxyqueuosine reductase
VALLASELKAKALDLGFDAAGICRVVDAPHWDAYRQWLDRGMHGSMDYLRTQLELKRSPAELLPGARSLLAVALHYGQPLPYEPSQPKIARYALGRDYHKVLRGKLRRVAAWLHARNPEAQTRICVDSAPILERDYARMAGIGWFGKNTCLIDSRRGSWFFLGFLLTSLEIEPDRPAVGSCGSCRKCIEACPTGAIVEADGRWHVDARACISYLTIEHRGKFTAEQERAVGEWTFGCDVCQEVCPFNTERASQPLRAPRTREQDFLQAREWPSLVELAKISEEEWDEVTRGSAVRRAGWEGLRRNARANLLNLRRRIGRESGEP